MSKIMYCKDCERYTLQEFCKHCGIPTKDPSPPKYSPQDKYGKYRRKMKELMSNNE